MLELLECGFKFETVLGWTKVGTYDSLNLILQIVERKAGGYDAASY